MPLFRAWRRMGPFAQIATVASVAILLVGSVAIGTLGWSRSGCVSNRIVARNDTQVRNLEATDAYSAAQERYISEALRLRDRAAERAAFLRLGVETKRWHDAVHAAMVAADKHPLSAC